MEKSSPAAGACSALPRSEELWRMRRRKLTRRCHKSILRACTTVRTSACRRLRESAYENENRWAWFDPLGLRHGQSGRLAAVAGAAARWDLARERNYRKIPAERREDSVADADRLGI